MLAHSLRDAGTTKKLAILVTLDSVSAAVVTQLKASYIGHLRSYRWLPATNCCAGCVRLRDPGQSHPQ